MQQMQPLCAGARTGVWLLVVSLSPSLPLCEWVGVHPHTHTHTHKREGGRESERGRQSHHAHTRAHKHTHTHTHSTCRTTNNTRASTVVRRRGDVRTCQGERGKRAGGSAAIRRGGSSGEGRGAVQAGGQTSMYAWTRERVRDLSTDKRKRRDTKK